MTDVMKIMLSRILRMFSRRDALPSKEGWVVSFHKRGRRESEIYKVNGSEVIVGTIEEALRLEASLRRDDTVSHTKIVPASFRD